MHPRQTILGLFLSVALVSVFIYTSINLLEPSLVQPTSQPAAVSDFNSSLIAHYTFDDGTATDATGSHAGTVSGATATEGKIGGALAFDGATNYVDLGDMTAVEGQSALSVSMWVKNNASANVSGGDTMISKEGSGADTLSLSWAQNEDVSFCLVGSTSGVSCGGADTATASYVDGIPEGSGTNWNHIVGVLDSGTVKVYVNGIQGGVAGTLSSPTQNSVHSLKIGSTWAGSIDDVRIYNKALSTQEIADLYALGGGVVGQAPPPPVTPPTDPATPPVTPPVTPPTTPPVQEVSVRSTAPSPVSWTPPIGIPEPPFGIRESHYMYQLGTNETCTTTPHKCYDFGSGLEPYRDAGAGPYTHYIDPSSPSCTNTSNPYGTKTKPRCGIPAMTSIVPGSVVELHGTYDRTNAGNLWTFTVHGTLEKPIFVRGESQQNKVAITNIPLRVRSSYTIFENLHMITGKVDIRAADAVENVSYVSLRHSDLTNESSTGVNGYTNNASKYVVFFDNKVYTDNFDLNGPEFPERDVHGIGFAAYAENVWIVDNDIRGMSGDAIGNGHGGQYTVKNFYIGRNLLHDTGENAVDLKEVENFVVSQNKMYNFKGLSSGSDGGAVVIHYGPAVSPKNAWFLFNEIYNATDVGIQVGGDQVYDSFFIGNIVHDIHNSSLTGLAFTTWNSCTMYFVHNVFYNNDNGVKAMSSGGCTKLIFQNNIVSNFQNPNPMAFSMTNNATFLAVSKVSNNIFYQPGKTLNVVCTGCLESNPLFNNPSSNDFSLQSGSPAINTADNTIMEDLASRFYTSYGIDIRKDFLGNNRRANTPWDIGAYEYGATGGTQPPPAVVVQPTDTLPPSPAGMAVTNITSNSATVSWNTSEAGTTQVEYGLTTAYGNTTTRVSTYTTSHTQNLSNLQGNTLYHYRVISLDQAGNVGISPDQTFTTLTSTDNDGDGVLNAVDRCPLTPSSLRTMVNTYGCPLPRTTRFTLSLNLASQDLISVPAFDISNTYGKISYSQTSNPYKLIRNTDDQIDIDSNLTITKGLVSLDSTQLPELNKRATITLYNLNITSPRILKDGNVCSGCTFISYTNGTLIFSVPSFSTYSVIDDSDPTPTTHTVSVTKMGSGTGTVTGTGISCGSDCSETVSSSITLTASPSSDSTFSGWSGGYCTGTSSCTITPSSDITIIATFAYVPTVALPEPSISPSPRISPVITTPSPSISPRSISITPLPRVSPVVTPTKTLKPDLVLEDTTPLPEFLVPTLWEQFIAYIQHVYQVSLSLITTTWMRIWGGVVSIF